MGVKTVLVSCQLREVRVSGTGVFTECNELHLGISGRGGGCRKCSFHEEEEIVGNGGVDFDDSGEGGRGFGSKGFLDTGDMEGADHFIHDGGVHFRVDGNKLLEGFA